MCGVNQVLHQMIAYPLVQMYRAGVAFRELSGKMSDNSLEESEMFLNSRILIAYSEAFRYTKQIEGH